MRDCGDSHGMCPWKSVHSSWLRPKAAIHAFHPPLPLRFHSRTCLRSPHAARARLCLSRRITFLTVVVFVVTVIILSLRLPSRARQVYYQSVHTLFSHPVSGLRMAFGHRVGTLCRSPKLTYMLVPVAAPPTSSMVNLPSWLDRLRPGVDNLMHARGEPESRLGRHERRRVCLQGHLLAWRCCGGPVHLG